MDYFLSVLQLNRFGVMFRITYKVGRIDKLRLSYVLILFSSLILAHL